MPRTPRRLLPRARMDEDVQERRGTLVVLIDMPPVPSDSNQDAVVISRASSYGSSHADQQSQFGGDS